MEDGGFEQVGPGARLVSQDLALQVAAPLPAASRRWQAIRPPSSGKITVQTRARVGAGISGIVTEVMTPALPNAERTPEKMSGRVTGEQVTSSPEGVTTSSSST